AGGTFTFFYVKYSRLIDEKLNIPFTNTSMLFASPRPVMVGAAETPEGIATELRRGGYAESRNNRPGYYVLRPNEIGIDAGPDSYFDPEGGVIKFAQGRVTKVVSLRDNTERTQYLLEPELISNLFDKNREKRRLVRFKDISKVLMNAVISAEDK